MFHLALNSMLIACCFGLSCIASGKLNKDYLYDGCKARPKAG
jgi:hypothetical protein